MKKRQKIYLGFKRIFDIIVSFFSILLLGWLMLIICLLQLIFNPGHVLFVQKRVGKDGKEFKLLKFRSMSQNVNHEMTSEEVGDIKNYTTKFGRFLRKSSLDELPQLFNIFIGQMSLIGPRPLINKDNDAITIEKRKENGSIHLRPGITGLAQISGRINLDPIKKAQFDGEYYQKISFGLDLKIFFMTFLKIIRSEDTEKKAE